MLLWLLSGKKKGSIAIVLSVAIAAIKKKRNLAIAMVSSVAKVQQ